MRKRLLPAKKLSGSLSLGGDKSISHRAIILSSLCENHVKIKNFYPSTDCLTTLSALRRLGVRIKQKTKEELDIYGVGLSGLKVPHLLSLGNSGTTYRLLAGLLAGKKCIVSLKSGSSLSKRPMGRIVLPLSSMGASITGCSKGSRRESYPPLLIKGGNLKGITYQLPVASAQVKSAILLAGLSARGNTKIIENFPSRDHTERMLKNFGADISIRANSITLHRPSNSAPLKLKAPRQITIAGDFSSAAFFIVGALLLEGSKLVIKRVGVNPTRTGLLNVLKRMNANFKVIPIITEAGYAEPVADIVITSSKLKATEVSHKEVPLLIDEVPILMVAASLAKGTTSIRSVAELRVKETDRISSMCYNLRRMGVDVSVKRSRGDEDIYIRGISQLQGASLKSFSDHRTAMAVAIAATCAKTPSILDDANCIQKSFPDFFTILMSIAKF